MQPISEAGSGSQHRTETAECCPCPGDSVPHENAPRTRPRHVARRLRRTRQILTGTPAFLSGPIVPQTRSDWDYGVHNTLQDQCFGFFDYTGFRSPPSYLILLRDGLLSTSQPPPNARNVPTAARAESARVLSTSLRATSSCPSASRTSVSVIAPAW